MRKEYPVLTTDAYILHTYGIGEADRVLTALTRHHGLLRAHARGVRKEAAKMRGAVQPYGRTTLSVILGRKNILKDIAVTDTLAGIWSDRKKYTLLARLLLQTRDLIPITETGNRELFPIVESAVLSLKEAKGRDAEHILPIARIMLLEKLGYARDTLTRGRTFDEALREIAASPDRQASLRKQIQTALYHQQ